MRNDKGFNLVDFINNEFLLNVELFKYEERAYAHIKEPDNNMVVDVDSDKFKLHLKRQIFKKNKGKISKQEFEEAIEIIKGIAIFERSEKKLHNRVAKIGNVIYIDLHDKTGRVVKVDEEGYQVINCPDNVKFRHTNSMQALPTPHHMGCLKFIGEVVNYGNDDNLLLIMTWMVDSMISDKPFAILDIEGQQGSGKSLCSEFIIGSIDPSKPSLKSLPRTEEDLVISVSNRWINAFDNLSGISNAMSDNLCKISTGGGITRRKKYSDSEEMFIEVSAPIMVNGIDSLANRADLADRAILIDLPTIEDKNRTERSKLDSKFNTFKDAIFGGLCKALSYTLKHKDGVKLEEAPRMADFAKTGICVERHLGYPDGSFMRAYRNNRVKLSYNSIESNPFLNEVIKLIEKEEEWSGSATELHEYLRRKLGDRNPNLPKNSSALSRTLNREAPNLRKVGLIVDINRNSKGSVITLGKEACEISDNVESEIKKDSNHKYSNIVEDTDELAELDFSDLPF